MEFKDTKGHSWNINLNIGTAMQVNELLELNLFEPSFKKEEDDVTLIVALLTDDLLFGKLLSVLCYSDIQKVFPGEEGLVEFYSCLDGETLHNAEEVFLKEYERFFTGRHREVQKLYVQETVSLVKKFRTSQAQEFGKSLESAELATQESLNLANFLPTEEE